MRHSIPRNSCVANAVKYYNLWSYQKVYEALTFLLDNIYIDLDLNYIDKL